VGFLFFGLCFSVLRFFFFFFFYSMNSFHFILEVDTSKLHINTH